MSVFWCPTYYSLSYERQLSLPHPVSLPESEMYTAPQEANPEGSSSFHHPMRYLHRPDRFCYNPDRLM